jgi:glycosyltransferase involved in cell wall biosynthesis
LSQANISVGIPAYNQGSFIAQTIESLLAQTVPPYEIVVSDNHSTDQTHEVLIRYRNRVRVVRPCSHLSMVEHWQFVASQLSGEWISLLSSDDIALPNYIKDFQAAISSERDAVLIRAPFLNIDIEGRYISTENLSSVPRVSERKRNLLDNLLNPKVGFAAFCVKRQAFELVGGFPQVKLLGDWGLWLALSTVGAFVKSPNPISKYRCDYRPDLLRDRMIGFIHDESILTDIVIPKASERVSGVSSRVSRSELQRFQRLLAGASEAFPYPHFRANRMEVCELLRSRAAKHHKVDELMAFCEGRNFSFSFPWQRTRHAYRWINSKLKLYF